MREPGPQIDTRPGVPPTSRGGRTRQRILEAAAELIHQHGAAATTIQQVRDATGVSASQLYHYFADKQQLVRAVVEYQGGRMLAGQHAAKIESLDDLRRWRDRLVANQDQALGGCPLGTLGSELAETDPSGRDIAADEFNLWRDAITAGLGRIRQRSELRPDTNIDELAIALLAALQGGLLLAHITQTIEPLQTALDTVIAQVEVHAG
jgi:TetR/AcrR family transcriptional regulator, transcriptional repressor for nem operon